MRQCARRLPPLQATRLGDGSSQARRRLGIHPACNTASDGELGAEAFSGQAPLFIYAGARALLVSHWYVNSDATVARIKVAFAELKAYRKIGRAEALRRSMSASSQKHNKNHALRDRF